MNNFSGFKNLSKAGTFLLIVLALFLVVKIFGQLKEFRYIGSGVYPQQTITISGSAEVFAVPDTASFSFTLSAERPTAGEAQNQVTEKMNGILEALKEFAIEPKDIKTLSYNLQPQYEFYRPAGFYPPPFNQRLSGYQLSQTVSLKVRELDKAGEILGQVGQLGVSNLSALEFKVADEDSQRRAARKMAIENGKKKAEELSRDLGVRLVRLVGFSEGGDFQPFEGRGGDLLSLAVPAASPVPQLPAGENKFVSQVYLTYEIK